MNELLGARFDIEATPEIRLAKFRGSAMQRILAVSLLIAAMAGCQKNIKNNVEMGIILPPGAERMKIPDNEKFVMPSPLVDALPNYPEELKSRNIRSVSTCGEIVINEKGAVEQVTPLYEIPECPEKEGEVDQAFVTAMISSMKGWKFTPPMVCTFPIGAQITDDCSGAGVLKNPIAIKLSFTFSFESESKRVSMFRRKNN